MNNPVLLNIKVKYDGRNIAYDLDLDREIDELDRNLLAHFIEQQIAPAVKKLTFKPLQDNQPSQLKS